MLTSTMNILSIETSCDETAVSIIEASGTLENPTFKILGNALYSQISAHAEYGGVFPALAKREHIQNLVPMLKIATEKAFETVSGRDSASGVPASQIGVAAEPGNMEMTGELKEKLKEILSRENDLGDQLLTHLDTHEVFDVDAIAVTQGPGLEPALWVGISFAKALSMALNKPLIPINHMEGHIVSVLAESAAGADQSAADNDAGADRNTAAPSVKFPALALLISGGHTELVLSKNWHEYEIIGQTVDDAIGEAFDKAARLINLPYPGGPKISKLAAESRAENLQDIHKNEDGSHVWTLPRPMLKSPDFNFSFSGIKTAVLYAVRDKTQGGAVKLKDFEIKMLAEEFENAVTEVLVYKTRKATEETGAASLIIGGGVIANTYIRAAFTKLADEMGVSLFTPSVSLSTDNSVMIGVAGYLRWISNDADNKHGILQPDQVSDLRANGNLTL